MATKIGNVSYPDRVDGILKDKELGRAFWDFVKRNRALENLKMIALVGVASNEIIWERHIASGAPDQINISSALLNKAKALADAKDWKHKDWKGIVKDCEAECRMLLQSNYVAMFLNIKVPEFVKVHRERAEQQLKGSPSKVAKLLGISDLKTLKALMVAAAAGFKAEAGKLAAQLAKTEKDKAKRAALLKALKAQGLA